MQDALFSKWLTLGSLSVPHFLLENYRRLQMDEKEFVFVLLLQKHAAANNFFPELQTLAKGMGLAEAEVFDLLHNLIKKQLLLIESAKDENNRVTDSYSLYPLYTRLGRLFEQDHSVAEKAATAGEESELLAKFEREFGRALSPIEMEIIGKWLDEDHYDVSLIEAALKEAVLNQVFSLKYVDRILFAWEKKNIKSNDQIKRHTQNRKIETEEQKNEEKESAVHVPLFNWLDSEN